MLLLAAAAAAAHELVSSFQSVSVLVCLDADKVDIS